MTNKQDQNRNAGWERKNRNEQRIGRMCRAGMVESAPQAALLHSINRACGPELSTMRSCNWFGRDTGYKKTAMRKAIKELLNLGYVSRSLHETGYNRYQYCLTLPSNEDVELALAIAESQNGSMLGNDTVSPVPRGSTRQVASDVLRRVLGRETAPVASANDTHTNTIISTNTSERSDSDAIRAATSKVADKLEGNCSPVSSVAPTADVPDIENEQISESEADLEHERYLKTCALRSKTRK